MAVPNKNLQHINSILKSSKDLTQDLRVVCGLSADPSVIHSLTDALPLHSTNSVFAFYYAFLCVFAQV